METTNQFTGRLTTNGEAITVEIPVAFDTNTNTDVSILQKGKITQPVSGVLNSGCKQCETSIPNAKLSFIKLPANKFMTTYNNCIYDICYSNQKGYYYAFLEAGIYKIRVDIHGKQWFVNKTVNKGIEEYFLYTKNASVKTKYDDVSVIYGTDKVLVNGCIMNEYDLPYTGEIVISQDDKLITFIKTTNGKYNFLIDYGVYTVRLRSNMHSVQIFNFNFQPGKGFFTELVKGSVYHIVDNYLNKAR